MDLIFPLLILFMIGLVFMSSRQRKKQASQQESLQGSLNVGDVVVMTSGISGTIVEADDERTIDLEIAPDVITTWLRAAVRERLVGDVEAEHEALDAEDHALGESSAPTGSTPAVTDTTTTATTTSTTPSTTPSTTTPSTTSSTGEPEDARTGGADGVSSPRSS